MNLLKFGAAALAMATAFALPVGASAKSRGKDYGSAADVGTGTR